jgi:SapC
MIINNMHTKPTGLDSNIHRHLKLRLPVQNWSVGKQLNALFVAAGEFADACREFPIVFVKSAKEADGTEPVAPIAVFGVSQAENLFLVGERWRGRYMPAVMRMYPFCMARVDEERLALCIDMAYSGANESEGEALFDAEGKPSEWLKGVQKQLEDMELEIQRTRAVCVRLQELDLLRDMRFDATLPGGRKHTVDGFLVVDEDKVRALPDAQVLELHRNGVLGLIHLHWMSMRNMHPLLEWHVERSAALTQA